MSRKWVYSIALVHLLGLCSNASAALVVHWKLDDGQGKIASDSSGNGRDGTFSTSGAPTWVAGKMSGALEFHSNKECVQYTFEEQTWPACTVAVWVKMTTLGQAAYRSVFSNHTPNTAGFQFDVNGGNPGSYRIHPSGLLFGTVTTDWVHLAMTSVGTSAKLYYNGSFVTSGTLTDMLFNKFALAVARSASGYPACTIDDLRVYDHALSAAEVQNVMNGVTALPPTAADPSPADKATDIPRDVVLSWKPGLVGQKHDMYFGTNFDDVNAATVADPRGVLAGTGQDANTLDPAGLLQYGTTCYWRIDEVNTTPDATVFKGEIWSFTVEPFSYPLKDVTAAASSAQPDMGPENTANGSGLNGNDQHSTDARQMWLSAGGTPNWIQYEFDKVYRLDQLWVWNSNQQAETIVGFGAKDVAVEYSTDGSTWTPLAGVPVFTRATGLADYVHDTTIDFGGVLAKYVKLTINSTWGERTESGLSEVRFFYVPVQAREPEPTMNATGRELDSTLNWRPGREAASHKVYVSDNRDAVANGTAPVETASTHSFDVTGLDFGTTYYWRVDEVNDAAAPASWQGDVWAFTTKEYEVIDDFESYTNESPNRVFQAWIDGWGFSEDSFFPDGHPGNRTTAAVGYDPLAGDIMEKTVVHGDLQAMPFDYNNTREPYYAETERTWATPQNWEISGADTLSLYFQGYPEGFIDSATGITMSSAGTDIWGTADQFRFAWKRLTGDGSIFARVERIDNTNAWAKAGVMIRDTLDAGSRFAYAIMSPTSGASFGRRETNDAACASVNQASIVAPYWVKLTRTGDVLKAEISADGQTWMSVGTDPALSSATVVMASDLYIGLCVTSHNTNAKIVTTGVFSNITTSANVTGSWQMSEIGIDSPENSPQDLYVVVQDSAGKSATVTWPNGSNVATWTEWKIPLTQFTGVSLGAVEKMFIGVGDRSKSTPGGTGRLYIDDIGFGRPIPQSAGQ